MVGRPFSGSQDDAGAEQMVVFGERILVKVAVSRAGRRAGLESAFTPAMYVEHHGRSGALMALTEHGAVNARSFKRLSESDRFVASELEKLKGLPWNLNGSLEAERLDSPLIAGPDVEFGSLSVLARRETRSTRSGS